MALHPLPFILASTRHGTLILNHLDRHAHANGQTYGVGHEILRDGALTPNEIEHSKLLLNWRREKAGDGVVAIDCGANIGVMTVEWARHMTGWGEVLAIEAQERLYYALAGNICISNCFNARCFLAAVGNVDGQIPVPQPDYRQAGSFGSLELKKREANEFIGQPIDYGKEATRSVRSLRLDSASLARVDLLKIDVEGMEDEVLEGATETIKRFRPYLLIEHLKVGREPIERRLKPLGYKVVQDHLNLLAMPEDDANWKRVRLS